MKLTNNVVGKDYVTPKDALHSMMSNHVLEKDSCYDPEPDAITDILSHAVSAAVIPVMILRFWTDRDGQPVYTQIRLTGLGNQCTPRSD